GRVEAGRREGGLPRALDGERNALAARPLDDAGQHRAGDGEAAAVGDVTAERRAALARDDEADRAAAVAGPGDREVGAALDAAALDEEARRGRDLGGRDEAADLPAAEGREERGARRVEPALRLDLALVDHAGHERNDLGDVARRERHRLAGDADEQLAGVEELDRGVGRRGRERVVEAGVVVDDGAAADG